MTSETKTLPMTFDEVMTAARHLAAERNLENVGYRLRHSNGKARAFQEWLDACALAAAEVWRETVGEQPPAVPWSVGDVARLRGQSNFTMTVSGVEEHDEQPCRIAGIYVDATGNPRRFPENSDKAPAMFASSALFERVIVAPRSLG